jgi:lincosamide nucleotidyltransferase A/C/D/E
MAYMDFKTALLVLECLRRAGIDTWIEGGWGVDALVGRQTRPHDDLDISFSAEAEAAAIGALTEAGFHIDPDEDFRPVRFVMVDREDHRVDLHPVVFDADGNGLQANFDGLPPFDYPGAELGRGSIAGQDVGCISVALQMRFHTGYALKHKDRADIAVLATLG